MTFLRGENVQVVVGVEDSFNAGATTPAGWAFPLASVDGGRSREWDFSPVLRGDPFQGDPLYGMKRSNLTLRVPVTAETAPMIAKKLGALSSTGTTTPYTHTAVGSATVPGSLWIERWFSDGTLGDVFFGCRMAGMRVSISGKQPQPLFMEIPIVGSGDDDRNTTARYDTSPDVSLLSTTTIPVHVLKDVKLEIGGSTVSATIVDGMEFSLNYPYNAFDHLDGNDYSAAVEPSWYEVSGSITGLWDDADTLRAFEQETTSRSIALYSYAPGTTATYVKFEVPRAFFNVEADFSVGGPGPVKGTVAWKGAYNTTDTSSWKIITVNSTANYSSW